MKKDINKREDLIGREIIHNNKLILISEAWERTYKNPNVKDWHGKIIYSLSGYHDIQRGEKGESKGIYIKFDVLKEKVEFTSRETP